MMGSTTSGQTPGATTLSGWLLRSKVMGVLDQLRYYGTTIVAMKTSRRSLLRCHEVSCVEGPL